MPVQEFQETFILAVCRLMGVHYPDFYVAQRGGGATPGRDAGLSSFHEVRAAAERQGIYQTGRMRACLAWPSPRGGESGRSSQSARSGLIDQVAYIAVGQLKALFNIINGGGGLLKLAGLDGLF